MPPGPDPDVYARLVTELKTLGVISVLDTDGEPMRAGLRAEPAVVAPNVARGGGGRRPRVQRRGRPALGLTRPDRDGRRRGDHHEPRAGARRSSAGGRDRRRYEVEIEQLEPIAAVGSGDAFLAGYVAARYEGRLAAGLPRLRRRLRGAVDAALRRRHARPRRGRAAAAAGRGRRDRRLPPGCACEPRFTAVIIARTLEFPGHRPANCGFRSPSPRGFSRPRSDLAWVSLRRRS